ncbi:ABC-F family ATP-binding cassette domain-containing protein [Niabella beijingensis]|uniref:ABC-F family ATP-binding cassette domain-containing protein n=1 Tax=Niabella beijingensis TaxID=2872700 RepID=UPI001CBEB1C3|nr:ABC-F family ATP-binding cassette domain-containing protein [Niabella beijingensis]MBZ4192383.1 ABC-F family ATP-binding cassette domain-containing protein [Niabella beijingensis]
MHYVSAEGLGKSYGIQPLFSDISFHIEEGDKVAIVARNGTGKSTLLKILAGKETPDAGKLWVHKDVEVILFEQEPDLEEELTVSDNIFFHNHPTVQAIREYELASESGNADRIGQALVRMDELNAWDFDSRVKQIFGKLNIHHLDQKIKTLSGGQKKRVALARTLIDIGFEHKHVLLIMDEPTNHLDVGMVEWLEHFLGKENVTLVLVTHDRYFLDAVCDEIWEMEGGELFVHRGDYEYYLEKKALRIENLNASIDKARNLYRRELEWMRKQPKARTTKSKSREDNFYAIEKTAKQQVSDDQLQLQMKMNRLGGKVVELKKVYKSFGSKKILDGFDYTFKKGERAGVIGKNGAGKSTFINILQGVESADNGKINVGDTVVFGNYSQQGLILKEDMRVIEFVKNIAENFPLADGSTLSASQFLQLFLFDPDKQYTYISRLSGGEKRRLHLLSILFRNPNFLILDEPTNDLDLPTLSVLENFLSEYPGCLLIVSHDRYFMDRLVDHLFVFEGDGVITDFPGNYTQYRLQEKSQPAAAAIPARETSAVTATQKPGNKKVSFKEKREYEQLEKEIAGLNAEKETITAQLSGGTTDFEQLEALSRRIGEITGLLDEKELRWLELSELIEG